MPTSGGVQRLRILAFGAVVLGAPVAAQPQGKFPPDSLKNVQALPEGTTVKQLVETMRGFTRALGVRCTYCHVGTRASRSTRWTSWRTPRPPRRTRGR